jgi:hypothetical protein
MIHQLLVCTDINLLCENINIKKIEDMLDASEQVGLEVNVEEIKYFFMSFTSVQDKIIYKGS